MITRRDFFKAAAGGVAMAACVGALVAATQSPPAAAVAAVTFPSPCAEWGPVVWPKPVDLTQVYAYGRHVQYMNFYTGVVWLDPPPLQLDLFN